MMAAKTEGELGFICHVCGNSYANQTYLKRHIKDRHTEYNEEHQRCPKCSQTFKDLKTFWGHILLKHEKFGGVDYEQEKEDRANKKELKKDVEQLKRARNSNNPGASSTVKTAPKRTEVLLTRDDPLNYNHWIKDYSCVPCDKSFFNKSGLMRHLKNVHSVDVKLLKKTTKVENPDEEILKQFEEQESEFSCVVCDLDFVTADAEIRHKKYVHGILPESEIPDVQTIQKLFSSEPKFRCRVCGDKFHKLTSLEKHFLTTHIPNATAYLSCTTCELEFISMRGIARHKRIVHGVIDPDTPDEEGMYPIQCSYCPRIVRFKDYKSHVKEFHKEHYDEVKLDVQNSVPVNVRSESVACQICQKTFNDLKSLKRHNGSVHATRSAQFACSECGKEFKDAGSLRDHLIVHQKLAIEPYVKQMLKEIFGTTCHSKLTCSLCQTVTISSFEARIHIYIKHPETFKKFVTEKAMNVTQNAAFPCPICLQHFPTTKDTVSHIESNHPEAEIPTCYVCGHKELKERDMNLHFQRLHPNTSRYSCGICNATFKQGKQLRLHITRDHTDEGVQCPYCPERHVKVKLHVTKKHPDKAEEYKQMVADAIREEVNARMEFNQLIDGGVPGVLNRIRKGTKKRMATTSDGEDVSNVYEENEDEEIDALGMCETKLKPAPEAPVVLPPPRPETFVIEKHVDKHVIEVHRLSPPPQPVPGTETEPDTLDLSDPLFTEGNQEDDNETQEPVDVKPGIDLLGQNLSASSRGIGDTNVEPGTLTKSLRICLERLTPTELEKWKRPTKVVNDSDDNEIILQSSTDNNDLTMKTQKPISRKRKRRRY